MKRLFSNKSKKRNFFMVMVLMFFIFTLIPANNVFAETFTTIGGTVVNEKQDPLRIDVGREGGMGVYLWQGTSYVKQYYGDTSSISGYSSWGSNLFFSDLETQKHYFSPYFSNLGYVSGTQFGLGTTTKLDDNTVETIWNVEGGNLRITQKIHYAHGEEYFEKEWKIENLSQNKTCSDFKFIHGGDTYFGGSDSAKSYWNPLLNMVYVKNNDMARYGLMGFSGNNNSPADRYFGGQFLSGCQFAFNGNLPNTAYAEYTDAGYQLQWNRSQLAPGEVWTINATERWTPAGFVQVIAPSPKTVAPNSTIAYEFTVQNFREDNNDPVSDTFDISVVSSNEWPVSIRGGNSVTIDGGGATRTVIVDLQVPSNAVSTNTITVTATSQSDNTISNSSSLITTVDTEIKAITGVTINPSSITAGREKSVSVDIITSNVTNGAIATAELVDGEKQSLAQLVTSSSIVTSGSAIITLNIPESIESGNYYIKVNVEGVDSAYDTAQLIINEPSKILTGIEITTSPTKTAYIEGQSFDNTGMKVTATYKDGTTEIVTGYTVNPDGALTISDTKVTVSYEGKTAEQLITVETKIENTFIVTGNVNDEAENDVHGAIVKIMAGSRQIGQTTTDSSGNFMINNVPVGTYNLVIKKADQTITLTINVVDSDVSTGTVILPNGKKNSVVEVEDGVPDIVVDNLNIFFDSNKFTDEDKSIVENGGTVEIKLIVKKESESEALNAVEIKAVAGNGKTIGMFLDLTLNKTVTSGSAITSGSAVTVDVVSIKELDNLLEINIPLTAELQGKNGYVIYRYHNSAVDVITESVNSDGEYIVVSPDKKSITLYTKKFSTYAIAYTSTNNDNNNNNNAKLPTIKTEYTTGGKIKISTDRKIATIIPDEGYLIKDVTVDGKSIGNVEIYKFIDKKDHIISATFIKKSALPYYIQVGKRIFIGFTSNNILMYTAPNGVSVQYEENPKYFTDIEDHWAKENIDFVTEREIFEGTAKDIFNPQASMSRAMFVTVIGRLYERSYGSIVSNTTFSDVDAEAYYSKYVAWAHEYGIIEGIGNNKFSPDAEVTREQMSEIMFRFATLLNKAPQGAWMINITYPDKAEISDWAMDSAAYCQLKNIISGREGGKFAPKATATRAEVAAVIERFVNVILE